MKRPVPLLCILAGLLSVSITAHAAGRIEINQAAVNAAGGFPYTINVPGSYVLTSDLDVKDDDVTAISISTDEVTLDLNGFRILGPHSCSQGACTSGIGSGVGGPALATRRNISVFGGQISGFGSNCLTLGDSARVERMRVFDCGSNGIVTGHRSSVINNTVSFVGRGGIDLQGESIYAHNTVSNVDLRGSGSRGIPRGTATAGNYCDDGSCTPRGEQRFYLTTSTHAGSQAPTACASGFHMASIWEILNPTELQYDTRRGEMTEDSGLGPPSLLSGWIRTGKPGLTFSTSPGGHSCQGYTTISGDGTTIGLYRDWEQGFFANADSRIPWWEGNQVSCDMFMRVWCVER